MTERVSSEEAEAILLEHGDEGETICLICRGLRDLLGSRKERDDAGPVLEAATRLSDAEEQHHEGGYSAAEHEAFLDVLYAIRRYNDPRLRKIDAARATAEKR